MAIPTPTNEPVLDHAPGSKERAALVEELARTSEDQIEIPIVAGGTEIRSGELLEVTMPHRHAHVLATAHAAKAEHVALAVGAAMKAAPAWARTTLEERAAIFLRAAELLTTSWRARIDAACMLGQSKTIHQSEIDAVCELADFWRFNIAFLDKLRADQPISPKGQWNRLELRPLEGFVYAVTPFNFLSIAGNLPTAPILCGNVVLWKPATTSLFGAYKLLELLRQAGLPDGVLNLVPGHGAEQSKVVLESEHLAGIHFTGSTPTFTSLWKGVAANLERYRTFPRLVGETGGKDFIVAHPSADGAELATAIVRGGFEYQGQKCSAASRIYVPRSLWKEVRDRVVEDLVEIRYGDVTDFNVFGGAVIDRRAFEKIGSYVELAEKTAKIVHGGERDGSVGWLIQPTLVEVDDPKHRLMQEEIFGPVVTVYPYDDAKWSQTLELVDATSPFALTGAVFARDRAAITEAQDKLRQAAGNFYVNDKPTGAVVGQQPFGGARASGTNDKAGFYYNLLRWLSPRSIKETFQPPTDFRYPYMG